MPTKPDESGRRRKTGGRRPGSVNRFQKNLRESVLEAYQQLGGTDWLVEQGRANPTAFMNLLSKLLPKDVSVTSSPAEQFVERLRAANGTPL